MVRKRLVIPLTMVVLTMISLFSVINVGAISETIERTKEFTSSDSSPEYDGFSETISESGSTYELDDISYDKIKTEKKKGEKKTTSKSVDGNGSSYSIGQKATITVDGKGYEATLIDKSSEQKQQVQRYGEVSGNESYGLRSSKPSPPATKQLSFHDNVTGKNYTIDAPMTELKQTSSQWQDYTYIDIVVSNYTDKQFVFNGQTVKTTSSVLPSSYYSELLSMAGYNDDNHKINYISWTSQPYKSGSVTYRNARANIQAYSASYTAYYYKRFPLEDAPVYTTKLTYEYYSDDGASTEYTYKATAIYKLVEEPTENTTIQPTTVQTTEPENRDVVFTVKAVTTISLLLAVSAGFVILILFLMTKFKLRRKDRINRKIK